MKSISWPLFCNKDHNFRPSVRPEFYPQSFAHHCFSNSIELGVNIAHSLACAAECAGAGTLALREIRNVAQTSFSQLFSLFSNFSWPLRVPATVSCKYCSYPRIKILLIHPIISIMCCDWSITGYKPNVWTNVLSIGLFSLLLHRSPLESLTYCIRLSCCLFSSNNRSFPFGSLFLR